ncbi:hypothetical protein FPJ27_15180 [Burkholderia sp. MS455]|uniref:hypothetical protein n=1 Tax=Burkholderia sp. MS455 TaxID=2811788 RepID=UPI00195D2CC3|nr:hypothetical protein [Burkholderia sp. MS455]QRR07615.1 hypothetical protein FPJ27_15180 [Burkholderia sp. MS455]
MSVDLEEIYKLIAVSPPYFSFSSLYRRDLSEWTVYGDIIPEQPLGIEGGTISTAEAGRHLAILGSCAAALTDDGRHGGACIYYLVDRATWVRSSGDVHRGNAGVLTARARVENRNRNFVVACTELVSDENVLGALNVRYHAVPANVFQMIARPFKVDEVPFCGVSPYGLRLPLEYTSVKKDKLIASLRHPGYTHSSGHFLNFPIWPVAVVMYAVSQAMAHLISTLMGGIKSFTVERADIETETIASLSTPLDFHLRIKKIIDNTCLIDCVVVARDRNLGRLSATLLLGA